MTQDNIQTRRLYRDLYWTLPDTFILIDLEVIDAMVTAMRSDDMIAARKLMDEKISLWK